MLAATFCGSRGQSQQLLAAPCRCVTRGVQRLLAIIVCVSALLRPVDARAQETVAEPQPSSVESVRLALLAERLQLTDAWMLHEDKLERDRLRQGRWLAFAAHASFGALWGVVGVANLMEEGPPGWSVPAFGLSAGLIAMAVATRAIENDREGARWSDRLLFLQLGLAGAGIIAYQQGFVHERAGSAFLLGQGAYFLAAAAALSIMHLVVPSLYVSDHYAGYRARSDSERVQYGLSLLLEREQRQLAAAYVGFSLSVLNAMAYGFAAAAAKNTEAAPLLAILAGSALIQGSVNLIIHLASKKPSENILLGAPPPAGDKL